MSAKLTFEFGVDISEDDLITTLSNLMINNEKDTVDYTVVLIEKEKKDEGTI